MPIFKAIAYVLSHFDALTHVVIRVSSPLLFVTVERTYFKSLLKVYYRSVFVESFKALNTLSKILFWIKLSYFSAWFGHCLWKMCATPGACINETALFSSAAVVPQSKSTKVNLLHVSS